MTSPLAAPGSKLYYFGTREEVRLGDIVRIRRWLRRDLEGTVCYIPGVSPKNKSIEFEDVKQWGIRLRDGAVLLTIYAPEHVQPTKDVEFVSRGEGGGLEPDEELL